MLKLVDRTGQLPVPPRGRDLTQILSARLEQVVRGLALLLALFMILYPTAWLFLTSFKSKLYEKPIFSLRWYGVVFSDPANLSALLNTTVVALGALVLSTTLGVALAWLVARTDVPYRGRIEVLSILPFVTSPFVGAIGWVFLAGPNAGLLNVLIRSVFHLGSDRGPINIYGLGGMIWVIGIYMFPYVFLIVVAALRRMDAALEEAARVSGATQFRTTFHITLPTIAPALLSGMLLVFVLGMEQFAIPAILGIPEGIFVYTTRIYQYISSWPTNWPLASALSNVLLVTTIVGVYLHTRLLAKREYATVTGRGFRTIQVRLGWWRYPALALALSVLLVTVVLPYTAIFIASITRYWSADFLANKFTFDHYRFILVDTTMRRALRNTLMLSIVGATAAMILSVLIAVIVARARTKQARLLEYLTTLPMSFPAIVFAMGILAAYVSGPVVLYGTLWILLVGYVSRYLPYAFRYTLPGLRQIHTELEESSRVWGAGFFATLRHITLPLLKSSLGAAWILVFVSVLRDLPISLLLWSPQKEVVSVMVWDAWLGGQFGRVGAFSIVITIIALSFVVILRRRLATEIT